MPARIMSRRALVALCLAVVLHIAALIVMAATEADLVASAAFLLSWALLNFFWLALVRRPVVAALLSLELIVALTLLSRFKFDKLWMTVDFVDVMIIDRGTSGFLLTVLPALRGWFALTAAAPGIKVPAGYQHHFESLDGKARKLIVEGVGGPSWFTEYNVLTGLSVRSYGRFATSVTRIAAGHLNRGLPLSLNRCGYRLLIDAGSVKGL